MKLKLTSSLVLALLILTGCSDSTSEEFETANGNVVVKLIETIAIVSAQDSQENETITVSYDANNRVSSFSNSEQSSVLVYENDELANITGDGETFNIEELYESPYDAFETGQVLVYDSNNNPSSIRFFEEDYDFETNTYIQVEYLAEVSYDNEPNPYFHTLDAAGVIDVMDDVQLNFSMNIDAPEIIQARMLFPSKNISKIVYKDADGVALFEIRADYVYDADSYPTSATVTGTDLETSETDVYTSSYTYR